MILVKDGGYKLKLNQDETYLVKNYVKLFAESRLEFNTPLEIFKSMGATIVHMHDIGPCRLFSYMSLQPVAVADAFEDYVKHMRMKALLLKININTTSM